MVPLNTLYNFYSFLLKYVLVEMQTFFMKKRKQRITYQFFTDFK
jgi:hypothetical protein